MLLDPLSMVHGQHSRLSISASVAGQRWCMLLATRRASHFAESDVRRIVGNNLHSVLRHCRSADADVAAAAMIVASIYAADALPFVRQPVAEAMLALMEELVKSNVHANLRQIGCCMRPLAILMRWLSKPQRQKLVSLVVKLLLDSSVTNKLLAVWDLKMLWLVDDAPRQTYAEAEQQLRAFAHSDTAAVRPVRWALEDLFDSS
ncbi:PAO3 [Symbiodinium sp. CCMP2592]|nr:PAO3 [Symbiodinium sp. CCMP2592]